MTCAAAQSSEYLWNYSKRRYAPYLIIQNNIIQPGQLISDLLCGKHGASDAALHLFWRSPCVAADNNRQIVRTDCGLPPSICG